MRSNARVRLLGFDLDGTLVDSVPDLCYSLGAALASVDLPPPSEEQTRRWIGGGIEELIRRALADASARRSSLTLARTGFPSACAPPSPPAGHFIPGLFDKAFATFTACYADNLFVRSRLYPGVPETLDMLFARGMRLCCITNKRLRFATRLLEQAGIADRFELVLGGDSLPEKKPSPAPLAAAAERVEVDASASVLIGDSANDLLAAKAAGWGFILAAYGYGAHLECEARDGIVEIRTFADLQAHMEARPPGR